MFVSSVLEEHRLIEVKYPVGCSGLYAAGSNRFVERGQVIRTSNHFQTMVAQHVNRSFEFKLKTLINNDWIIQDICTVMTCLFRLSVRKFSFRMHSVKSKGISVLNDMVLSEINPIICLLFQGINYFFKLMIF